MPQKQTSKRFPIGTEVYWQDHNSQMVVGVVRGAPERFANDERVYIPVTAIKPWRFNTSLRCDMLFLLADYFASRRF